MADASKHLERAQRYYEKGKIEDALEEYLFAFKEDPNNNGLVQIIAELYLATLSRPAQTSEIEGSLKHIQATKDRRRALEDIHWALLNCKEFLFRH